MCGPTEGFVRDTKRVVISGAGPAGLLLASLLLNKNQEQNTGCTYDVTLIDGREDYGKFTQEELKENHRSWMLGLADHGMDAIKSLPDLYNNYVKGEGISVNEFNVYMGSKKVVGQSRDAELTKLRKAGKSPEGISEGFIVDRNFIVAALARYLRDTHGNDDNYSAMYFNKCQYVDYEEKRVLVRNVETNDEKYVPYDLLIGCDGVRSTVREALIKRHSNFSCEYTDIFQEFKQTHVKMPDEISFNSMSILPEIFPYCQGIALPERGGMINIGIGFARNNFDKITDELKSNDYKVVSEYVKKNFKAFNLVDCDDFAKQWASQRWNQTGMVHCNFYHSIEAGVVIMGDAAHATSPSIGMGMNTALRDAQIFSEILTENKDDFNKSLPSFSEVRVKEGNALSDLAFHLYCLDKGQQLKATFHMLIRGFFHSKFPGLVLEHPQTMIGRRGVSLSEVYEQAVKVGIMRKHRVINDMIRQKYFEQKSGMTKQTSESNLKSKFLFGTVLVAATAIIYQNVSIC